MVVDTHVKRLSKRLGWTRHQDPVKIEKDLCALIPAESWTLAGHLLIAHGRALCKAQPALVAKAAIINHQMTSLFTVAFYSL